MVDHGRRWRLSCCGAEAEVRGGWLGARRNPPVHETTLSSFVEAPSHVLLYICHNPHNQQLPNVLEPLLILNSGRTEFERLYS